MQVGSLVEEIEAKLKEADLRRRVLKKSMSTSSMNRFNCYCHKECVVFTCKKGDNEGRKFFRCSNNRLPNDCKFFKWCDETDDVSSREKKTDTNKNKERNVEGDPSQGPQIKLFLVVILVLQAITILLLANQNRCY